MKVVNFKKFLKSLRTPHNQSIIESVKKGHKAIFEGGKFNYMQFDEDERKKTIGINIWDDYWDDDTGKKQETHIYVEEMDISPEDKKEILTILLDYIKENFKFPKVKFKLDSEEDGDWRINVENLTHAQREMDLQIGLSSGQRDGSLSYKGKNFNIYSES